jgi:hypothetical protein
MAAEVGGVHVTFSATTKNLQEEMEKGRQAVRSFGEETRRAMQTAASSGSATGAISGGIVKIGDAVKGASASIGGFSQVFAAMGDKVNPVVKGIGTAISSLAIGGFTPLGLAIGLTTAAVGAFTAETEKAASGPLPELSTFMATARDRAERLREELSRLRTEISIKRGGATGGAVDPLVELAQERDRLQEIQGLLAANARTAATYTLTLARSTSTAEERERARLRLVLLEQDDKGLRAQEESLRESIRLMEERIGLQQQSQSIERASVETMRRIRAAQSDGTEDDLFDPATLAGMEQEADKAAAKIERLAKAVSKLAEENAKAFDADQNVDRFDEAMPPWVVEGMAAESDAWHKARKEREEALEKVRDQVLEATRGLGRDLALEHATQTDQEVAAIEDRYAELIARAREYGEDTVELERQLAARVKQIREDPDRQRRDAAAARERQIRDGTFGGGFNAGLANTMEQRILTIGQQGALVADSLADGFSNAFAAFATGAASAEDAFRNFAASFLRDIAAMIAKQLALNAVSGFASSFSMAGGAAATVSDVANASSAASAGAWALTGKRAFKGSGGGAGPRRERAVVNVYPQPGETASVRESDGPSGPQLDIVVERIVAEKIGRGGPLDKAMAGKYGLRHGGRRQ